MMLRVDMIGLESAFESRDHLFSYYLDTESGRCVVVPGFAYDGDIDEDMEADIELVDSAPAGRFVSLDEDVDVRLTRDDAREFVRGVEDERLRRRLADALDQRRGAFRAFNQIIYGEAGENERWHHFSRQRMHANIAAYLAAHGVHVTYDPLPPYEPRFATREHLLAGAAAFVERVKRIKGVQRVAVIGSIVTPKREPNDVDLLITVATRAVVPEVVAAGRKLQGHAQQIGRGADIFLADPATTYLGRTCPWRECGPGIRTRCEAQHCGNHLYDDLHVLTLNREVIASPPLELWPKVVVRQDVAADVLEASGLHH
jgi:predicted nucleotidyltransferase